MPITSLTSYFNASSFGDQNASTRNQKELALTLDAAARQLADWKGLVAMSSGGMGFELGSLAARTLFAATPALCAIPFLTNAFTFFVGVLSDTGLTRAVNHFLENGEEQNESFFEQVTSQSGVRAMGLLGAGQSFVVVQLLMGLSSVSQGMLCEKSSKGPADGAFLSSILQGLRCHFGSGMFVGLTGGVVNAVEQRMSLRTRNTHTPTESRPISSLSETLTPQLLTATGPRRFQSPRSTNIFCAEMIEQRGSGKPRIPSPAVLDRISQKLIAGKAKALIDMKKITDQKGYAGDMAIALEEAMTREITPELALPELRIRALDKLRKLESDWKTYRARFEGTSVPKKKKRVSAYVNEGHKKGLVLNLEDPTTLEPLHTLILLHEFLLQEAKLLHPFGDGPFPIFVTDLLLGQTGRIPFEGSCHSMMVLAVHLGRQAELDLQAYASEEHASVHVSTGSGFLYEPTGGIITNRAHLDSKEDILLPGDFYVRAYRAPVRSSPVSIAESILTQSLAYASYAFECEKIPLERATHFSGLVAQLYPQHPDLWLAYSTHLAMSQRMAEVGPAIERAIALFPDMLQAHLQFSSFQLEMKDYAGAARSLEEATRIILARERRADEMGDNISIASPHSYWMCDMNLGRVQEYGTNRYDLARERYMQALTRLPEGSPQHTASLNAFIRASSKLADHFAVNQEDPALAAELIQDTLTVVQSPGLLLLGGQYDFFSGNRRRAEELWSQGARLDRSFIVDRLSRLQLLLVTNGEPETAAQIQLIRERLGLL